METEVRRTICGLIIGMVITDGELTAEENEYVDRLIKRLDISKKDDVLIRPIADPPQAAATVRDLPAEAQEQALEYLIEAAVADGKVVPSERVYLEAVAEVVGWSTEKLDARVVEQLEALKSI